MNGNGGVILGHVQAFERCLDDIETQLDAGGVDTVTRARLCTTMTEIRAGLWNAVLDVHDGNRDAAIMDETHEGLFERGATVYERLIRTVADDHRVHHRTCPRRQIGEKQSGGEMILHRH